VPTRRRSSCSPQSLSIGWFAVREFAPGSPASSRSASSAMVVPALLACWLSMGVSRRTDMSRRDVTGWMFVALACGAACDHVARRAACPVAPTHQVTPLVGAGAHALMLLFGTIGVLHWVRRLSPSATAGTVLDLLCVAVLAYVVSWRTILSSALLDSPTPTA
jgi:hypothetical protein